MRRLLFCGLCLVTMLWPRPVAAQEECSGGAMTPEDTASVLYGQYLASGQWDLAYEVMHPEAQARLAYPMWASMARTEAAFMPLVDVQVFPAQVSPGWTWGLTGLNFSNVAEVPVQYTQETAAGPMPMSKMIALVQVGDCWRWLPPLP